jgi:thioredoxin 1
MIREGCLIVSALALFLAVTACQSKGEQKEATPAPDVPTSAPPQVAAKPESTQAQKAGKVTFVELGSVNCIPCKMMKPVMEAIEKDYGDQVQVVFHDVWTPAGKESGAKYQIRAIPTQVFLDRDGKEYHRHVGFYPLEEVVKILKQGGVQ